MSQRDYDNDGIENRLDTCPYNFNPSWDPRANNITSGGDTDGDGLADACDPNPASPNPDEDGDGWWNRADNCPTVSNISPVMAQPNYNQYDQDYPPERDVPDGGPPSDDIGPECDTASNTCTVAPPYNCPVNVPPLTPTGANGHYHATYAAQTICIGAATPDCDDTADADGDGVVNAHDTCIGTPASGGRGPNGVNPPTGFAGPAGQDTVTVAVSAGASTMTVGSTTGFTNGSPIMIGSTGSGPQETLRYITAPPTATTLTFTPPLSFAHLAGTDVRQVAFAQSIRDLNNDGYVDQIGDITKMTGRFGTQGGNPQGPTGNPPNGNYVARFDFNNDSFIDIIGDISKETQVYNATCGPH